MNVVKLIAIILLFVIGIISMIYCYEMGIRFELGITQDSAGRGPEGAAIGFGIIAATCFASVAYLVKNLGKQS